MRSALAKVRAATSHRLLPPIAADPGPAPANGSECSLSPAAASAADRASPIPRQRNPRLAAASRLRSRPGPAFWPLCPCRCPCPRSHAPRGKGPACRPACWIEKWAPGNPVRKTASRAWTSGRLQRDNVQCIHRRSCRRDHISPRRHDSGQSLPGSTLRPKSRPARTTGQRTVHPAGNPAHGATAPYTIIR
jgi:hypothetical protein